MIRQRFLELTLCAQIGQICTDAHLRQGLGTPHLSNSGLATKAINIRASRNNYFQEDAENGRGRRSQAPHENACTSFFTARRTGSAKHVRCGNTSGIQN
eukprot:3567008-Pyramimonas_sp.AAC.2